MLATEITQEQVDRVVEELAPDVVRIRFNVGVDWSDYPSIFFRVVLADHATERDRLGDVVQRVRDRLTDVLGLELAESKHLSYFRFRSQSEQSKLVDAAWD